MGGESVRTAQVIILITKKNVGATRTPWQLFLNLKKKKIARAALHSYNTLKEKNRLCGFALYEKRNFYILQRLGKRP